MADTPDEQDRWHWEHPPVLAAAEHGALMAKLGITREEDLEWPPDALFAARG